MVGVDIQIGLPETGGRAADDEARRFGGGPGIERVRHADPRGARSADLRGCAARGDGSDRQVGLGTGIRTRPPDPRSRRVRAPRRARDRSAPRGLVCELARRPLRSKHRLEGLIERRASSRRRESRYRRRLRGSRSPIAGRDDRRVDGAAVRTRRGASAAAGSRGAHRRRSGASAPPEAAPERGSRLTVVSFLAQLVEHLHGKEGVDGSSPSEGFRGNACKWRLPLPTVQTSGTRGHLRALAGVPLSREFACRAWLVQADPSCGDPLLADRELDARCSAGLARPYRR